MIETNAKTDGSLFETLSSVEVVSAEIETPLFRFDAGHFKVEVRGRGLYHTESQANAKSLAVHIMQDAL